MQCSVRTHHSYLCFIFHYVSTRVCINLFFLFLFYRHIFFNHHHNHHDCWHTERGSIHYRFFNIRLKRFIFYVHSVHIEVFLPELSPEISWKFISKIMVHKFINRYFHIPYASHSLFHLPIFFLSCSICIFSHCLLSTNNHVCGKNNSKENNNNYIDSRESVRKWTKKKCQANLLVYFRLPRRQQQTEKNWKNIRLLVYIYTNYACDTLKWHIRENLNAWMYMVILCVYLQNLFVELGYAMCRWVYFG